MRTLEGDRCHLSRPRLSTVQTSLCLVSLIAAASMWFYVDAILVRYQITDSAAHNRPRGNLSDLYPRWLGARELLSHGRNPYGNDITAEIQKGYFGRTLDPSLPNDPKDQQAFAYPVYVVFLLAPTIQLPFELVQSTFRWILLGVSIASVGLWLKVLRWNLSFAGVFICTVLLLGSFPEVQGLKLQQLSLLVAALLAAGAACVSTGYLTTGGAILALATIKPQLALPLVAALLLWTTSDCKARWRFAAGFAGTMGILLAASEFFFAGLEPDLLAGDPRISRLYECSIDSGSVGKLGLGAMGRFAAGGPCLIGCRHTAVAFSRGSAWLGEFRKGYSAGDGPDAPGHSYGFSL